MISSKGVSEQVKIIMNSDAAHTDKDILLSYMIGDLAQRVEKLQEREAALIRENKELSEYKWKYEGLCK